MVFVINPVKNPTTGFSIVEVIIVVAIIGALSAIATVSYGEISKKLADSLTELDVAKMASRQLTYRANTGKSGKTYYTSDYDSELDFSPSDDTIFINVATNDDGYCIRGYNTKGIKNSIDNSIVKESIVGICQLLPPASEPTVAPTPPTLSSSSPTNTTIDLSWTSVSGATNYILEQDTNSSFSSSTQIASQATTSFTSTSLNQGTIYYYRVNVTTASGTSDWSTSTNNTTTIATPSAPTVSTNTVGATTTFSWTTPTCASGTSPRYQYRYTITPAGYDSGLIAAAASPVGLTTSTVGQTYALVVRSQCYTVNAVSGWSAMSAAGGYFRDAINEAWQQIANGRSSHACAIDMSSNAYCWGLNDNGQLGNNSTVRSLIPSAVTASGVLSGKTILKISSGYSHTCVIASDNKVYCWGNNTSGQLGDNSTTQRLTPVAVNTSGLLAGKMIIDISTGSYHTCALDSNGIMYCWGNNGSGRLGNNSTVNSSIPVAVDLTGVLLGKTITKISSGNEYTCAVASDNQAYCWGLNTYGRLGNNSTTASSVPVAVYNSGVLSGKSVSLISAYDTHTCLLTTDNLAYCWGNNSFYQLGDNTITQRLVPVQVNTGESLNGKTINSISTGYRITCVLTTENKAYCWGFNNIGQIGNNSTVNVITPTAIDTSGALLGKSVESISIGTYHLCVLSMAKQAYCWGSNASGQLGNGSISLSTVPVPTNMFEYLDSKTISKIAIGASHACALTTDGQAYCWGDNGFGQLGNNSKESSSYPTPINMTGALSGKTIVAITAGHTHTCAIASDDQVYCWGGNVNRQLGNGKVTDSLIPVPVVNTGVLNGKSIIAISAGFYHTCIIASDNQAYCWGDNGDGQLGDNSIVDRAVPVAVDKSGLLIDKTIKSITVGVDHTCAIASDDNAYCWGGNTAGQLGNDLTVDSPVPVAVDKSGLLIDKTIKSITASAYATCAIASENNQAYCWGNGGYYQLGNGSSTASHVPVAVSTSGVLNGKTVVDLSSRDTNVCVIASDSKAYCWGMNTRGQLGNNSTTDSSIPVAVYSSGHLSGKNITMLASGFSSSCVVTSDNYIYCWGNNNSGQLGGVAGIPLYTPTLVVGH